MARGAQMRVAILDDIHHAYEATSGVHRLRDRAAVQIFTTPFGDPSALRGFDALIANRERTRFTRELLKQLPDLRIIAQTGNHAYHIDLAAAEELRIIVCQGRRRVLSKRRRADDRTNDRRYEANPLCRPRGQERSVASADDACPSRQNTWHCWSGARWSSRCKDCYSV
jgi:D-isomer specific 2-hydroxyacid dehydrogenase, catalytic domain